MIRAVELPLRPAPEHLRACLGNPAVRDRQGRPRRHLVQRDRDPEHGDSGSTAGRAACRPVLPADHDLRYVVLPDRTHSGAEDGRAQAGGDHDRHHTPLADGHPLVGGCGPAQAAKEALTRDLSAELALLRAFAWSVCDHRACRRQARCRARASRQSHGNDLGTVARVPREQDPSASAHDARGDGKHGGLHGFRRGEWDEGTSVNVTTGNLHD
jgi:hypothetical protein